MEVIVGFAQVRSAVDVLPCCVEKGAKIHQARDATGSEVSGRREVTDRMAGWSTTDLFDVRTETSRRLLPSRRRWGSCGRP